jgi:hypothetical protein
MNQLKFIETINTYQSVSRSPVYLLIRYLPLYGKYYGTYCEERNVTKKEVMMGKKSNAFVLDSVGRSSTKKKTN